MENKNDAAFPPTPFSGGEVQDRQPINFPNGVGGLAVNIVSEHVSGVTGEDDDNAGGVMEKLEKTRQAAMLRSEGALDNCEFIPTAEVREAVTGYFDDHLRLATIIESLVSRTVTAAESRILAKPEMQTSNPAINEAIDTMLTAYSPAGTEEEAKDPYKTQRHTLLLEAHEMVSQVLFREISLGSTLVGQEEAGRVVSLFQFIDEVAENEGFITYGKGDLSDTKVWTAPPGLQWRFLPRVRRKDFLEREIHHSFLGQAKSFWDDIRPAGKLLYHATPFANEVLESGGIASRSKQAEAGSFRATTRVKTGDRDHCNAPHWTGFFDPSLTYRISIDDRSGNVTAPSPATIAVPIAKIVEQIPFGRGCQYGVVKRKNGAEIKGSYKSFLVGDIGVGNPDEMGSYDTDRVFYASATDAIAGTTYKFDLFSGMRSAEGNNCCYVITTEYQIAQARLRNGGRTNADYPDEPDHPEPISIATGDRSQNIPVVQSIIAELEAKAQALPEFTGKYVVPLRQGVFSWLPESRGGSDWFAKAGMKDSRDAYMIKGLHRPL